MSESGGQDLRIDLIHEGSAQHEGYQGLGFFALPRLHVWPSTPAPDEHGEYRWGLFDKSGALAASRGFSPLFAEWQSTLKPDDVESARNFRECIVVPDIPGGQVVIERRDAIRGWRRVAVINIPAETDPAFLPRGVQVHKLHEGGDPAVCTNIVLISEGYGYRDLDLFIEDARRAADILLNNAPYSECKDKLNITAIAKLLRNASMPLSEKEDATVTNFDTCYGMLGMDRYIGVRDPHALYETIGNVPCDTVIVLCNSEKYGGCGLYNQHCALPGRIDPKTFEYLLLHEFGHSFAGLGDEYFDSAVTYTPEWLAANPPWEPNVSAVYDGRVKWQARIAADVPVPTPWRQAEYMELTKAARDNRDHVEPEEAARVDIDGFLRAEPYYGKTGAFEGARYTAHNLFRPEVDCRMFSKTAKHYCAVCHDVIAGVLKRGG